MYLATMRELRHASIGTVFLSQPPGFGWFLEAVGAVTSSLATLRAIMIAVALLGCAAAWFVGRRAAGALGGAITAAVLAIAPPWPVNASLLEAEVPSTAVAVAAIALAPAYPAAAGAALVLALSLKLLAVSAVVPVVILARRRFRELALGALVAAAVVTASVARRLGRVWNQAFAFHLHGRTVPAPSTGANASRLLHFLTPNTPFALLTLAAIGIGLVAVARHLTVHWALWTWPLAAAATLVVQHPLLDHHMDLFAAAWALPAGATISTAIAETRSLVRRAAVGVVAVLLAGGLAQQWRHLVPKAGDSDVAEAVARLQTLVPRGSLVAADVQIVPYLAGDRQPPQLVDLSSVRIGSGTLPPATILRDSRNAAAFVVGRVLADDNAVLSALRSRYRRHVTVGSIEIFTGLRR